MPWNEFWTLLMQAFFAFLILGPMLGFALYFILSGVASGLRPARQQTEKTKKEQVNL